MDNVMLKQALARLCTSYGGIVIVTILVLGSCITVMLITNGYWKARIYYFADVKTQLLLEKQQVTIKEQREQIKVLDNENKDLRSNIRGAKVLYGKAMEILQ